MYISIEDSRSNKRILPFHSKSAKNGQMNKFHQMFFLRVEHFDLKSTLILKKTIFF